jgi:hypothetical protein
MAIAIAFALFRTREPVADGRTLSEWLEESDWMAGREAPPEATNAIRKIGPSALPFLLTRLRATEPTWKVALQGSRYADKFPYEWLYSTTRQWGQAIQGFSVLGSNAAPAIADLSRMMTDSNVAWRASLALVSIGFCAHPAIKAGFTNPSPQVRKDMLTGIQFAEGLLGIESESFWTDVMQLTHDTNSYVVGSAMTFIVAHLERPGAIDVVRDSLTNSYVPNGQMAALISIKGATHNSFKGATNASLLVPYLVQVLTDSNSHSRVSWFTTNVLVSIDPVTAAAHGVNTNASF